MNNRLLLKYHSWLGLIGGGFLLIMGISGSILVFHEQIDNLIFSDHLQKRYHEKSQLDKAVGSVQAAYPGWDTRLTSFDENKVLLFDLRNQKQRRYVFVHPTTGLILEEINTRTHFTSWLLKLHYSLHAGAAGRLAILLFGIIFLLSLITGVILYRKSIIKTFTFRIQVKKSNKRNFYSTMHRYVGVWALLLNLVLVITGIVLAFIVSKAGLNPLSPPAGPPVEISIENTLKEITQKFPDFHPTYIRLPLQPDAGITIYGKYDEDAFYYSEYYNTIRVDYKTGEFLSITKVAEADFLTRLNSMVTPLHYAEFGGIGVKLLYCFTGLSGPFLSVTGFIIWRNSKRPRKKRRKALYFFKL